MSDSNKYFYKFPKSTEFGRLLPKNKIYEHATPSSKIKDLFVQQLEKIIWSYKLSPETINLSAKEGVQEIQIFTLILKTADISEDVLATIDKAIPFPLIFCLKFEDKIRYIAAYKRISEADKTKSVISQYFKTDWIILDDSTLLELPITFDLAVLYLQLLTRIIPLEIRQNESLEQLVERFGELNLKQREASKIQIRLNKEKQFNRKVELNKTLKVLIQAIEILK